MASVVQKYIKAYRMYGWRETLSKMYSVRLCVIVKVLLPSTPLPFSLSYLSRSLSSFPS